MFFFLLFLFQADPMTEACGDEGTSRLENRRHGLDSSGPRGLHLFYHAAALVGLYFRPASTRELLVKSGAKWRALFHRWVITG
jgi:hypothetical protein